MRDSETENTVHHEGSISMPREKVTIEERIMAAKGCIGGYRQVLCAGTVKYYAQIRLQVWQNKVCIGQEKLPLIRVYPQFCVNYKSRCKNQS